MPTFPAAIRPLQPQLAELFHGYLERVSGMARRGEAREESFYPLFADLLEGYAESQGWSGLQVLILPRKTNGCLLDLPGFRARQISSVLVTTKDGRRFRLPLDRKEFTR